MKSPRSASSRALLLVGLEDVGGDRQHLLLGHPLRQRRDERVVDEHDPVDLALDEQLGDAVRDRLGVRVRGPVGEADEGAVELAAPERERRAALLADRRASGRSSPRRVSWRSSAKARRITWALNAPARPRSPVSGTSSDGRDVLALLEQRQARAPSPPRARRRRSARASCRRTAASPRCASARGAASPRRRAPSPA